MRAAIVHFSDIHLRRSGNPVIESIDQLVNAVNSVDAAVSFFLVVVSGDIANTGLGTEYQAALRFFREFESKLRALRPDAAIEFVSVPGNHDCVLPKSKSTLRKTLVQGIIPSIQDLKQDEALIREVVKAQAPYNTALLSQNPEEQGELHVPMQSFEQQIPLANPVGLSISVFHHSYLWLESNVAVSFRSLIVKNI